MKISLLDQSQVHGGETSNQAFQHTIEAARLCDRLGYHRFWVSEHHNQPLLVGSSPEVLLAAIGANTSRIRIGSGGIMLPHYSPYKVAENISVLAHLYPGRVDVGVGRAPGTDMPAARALASGGTPRFEQFPQQVEQLSRYLWQEQLMDGQQRKELLSPVVSPPPPKDIPIWILGTSADSAILAAQKGLPYSVALFINPQMDERLILDYKSRFQPSPLQAEPQSMITLSVLCAATPEQASIMKKTADSNSLAFYQHGPSARFYSNDEAQQREFTLQEQGFIAMLDRNRAVGTPDQVKEKILSIAQRFAADEVMAVTNCYSFNDRMASIELLAKAFDLPTSNTPLAN